MTIPIEETNIRAENVVDGNSRYIDKKIVYYGDQRFITFETYIRTPYVPTGDENIMIINKGVEYRPDLVAYDVYGIPDPWWQILEANSMQDVWEFQAGKTIMLPSIF